MAPNESPESCAADEVVTYEAQWLCTLRNDQRHASTGVLLAALGDATEADRVGLEFSACGVDLAASLMGELFDIEPLLYELRRRKDADELARLRHAIGATGAMYQRARKIIQPGISELEVFNQLQTAAVDYLGERLTGTGNDYQCAAKGGPPRAGVTAQAGQLYILDLGPAFRGYFADNCRTIAVSEPTYEQQQAWETVASVFKLVEKKVKPGTNCKTFFAEVQAHLEEADLGVFDHHLGHGIGLSPHETPHLNPAWDDTFSEGDIFACEPGLYAPELNAGIRLENDYLVTATGVELLSDFPLEL